MKPAATLVVVWLLTALGAVAGSILGNAAGKAGLLTGAVVGGSGARLSVAAERGLAADGVIFSTTITCCG